jgi:hypothetical protein
MLRYKNECGVEDYGGEDLLEKKEGRERKIRFLHEVVSCLAPRIQ